MNACSRVMWTVLHSSVDILFPYYPQPVHIGWTFCCCCCDQCFMCILILSHALPLVLSDVSSMICLEIRIVKSSIFGMPALVQTRGNQDSCATSKGVRLMVWVCHVFVHMTQAHEEAPCGRMCIIEFFFREILYPLWDTGGVAFP